MWDILLLFCFLIFLKNLLLFYKKFWRGHKTFLGRHKNMFGYEDERKRLFIAIALQWRRLCCFFGGHNSCLVGTCLVRGTRAVFCADFAIKFAVKTNKRSSSQTHSRFSLGWDIFAWRPPVVGVLSSNSG